MPAASLNREVSDLVWRARYRAPGETSLAESWRRVARAVASQENDPALWSRRFHALLKGFRFLPGGRILAGAGTGEGATLNNCFVMAPPEDAADPMFASLRDSVATLAAGGGIGCDFSRLSPRGEPWMFGAPAPGPVEVLGLWDAACAALLGGARRRGAMMGTLRCDHPDIEAFLAAKRRPGALSRFNLSVQVTDAFLEAVKADAETPLIHRGRPVRSIRARALWELVARSAYETGEPGVLFVDTVRRENNLWWREDITSTNPCGEVPLPPYGACVLGSLNLAAFVREPFSAEARLDLKGLAAAARTAIRFLDDVIDLTPYPLPQQAREARETRRIGLGFTGLADALLMLGLTYGEAPSLSLAAEAARAVRDSAYAASVELAAEKGAFPAFDRDRYLDGAFIRRLPAGLRDDIARRGIRNSHLLAVAPTGSISLLAGGVSPGVEPVFAAIQTRALFDETAGARQVEIVDPAVRLWRERTGGAGEPPGFVTAEALSLAAHLDMQAALQPYVDNAISKTVNVRANCSFEAFRAVFDMAQARGLKGCAVFRPTPLREGVIAGRRDAGTSPCISSATVCD